MNFTPLEHDEQVSLIEWCDNHSDERVRTIYSHLNGCRLTMGVAIKAKAAGARSGIPDLFLPIPVNGYHGLYIELKRIKGGSLSPQQKERMRVLSEYGYYCVRCNGGDAAKRAIEQYLSLPDNN